MFTGFYALSIDTDLVSNWEDMIDPPKTGHLKDPKKVEAKVQEWRVSARETAKTSRLATNVVRFKFTDLNNTAVMDGNNAKELVESISSLSEKTPTDSRTMVYCFNARDAVSAAALEVVSSGLKDVRIPASMWFQEGFSYTCSVQFLDPLHCMSRSSEGNDRFLAYLGINPAYMDMGLEERHKLLLKYANAIT